MKQSSTFIVSLFLLLSFIPSIFSNAQSVNISQRAYQATSAFDGTLGGYNFNMVVGQPFGNIISGNGFIINEGILQPESPKVTSFSPVTGSTFSTVTIKGQNFLGASKVTFGDSSALSFSIINDSIITAIVGNGSSGNVGVFTPSGTHFLSGFIYNNTPIITSLSPFTGAVGTLVTIKGSNFFDTTVIKIGGVNALRISNTNNQIVAMVMPGAKTGNIVLTNGGHSATSGNVFTVSATLYPVSQQGNKLLNTDGSSDGIQGVGYSVSISADGKTALVGGSTDSLGLGAAWVYTLSGNSWIQQGKKLTPYGIGPWGYALTSPNFGSSVAISADGNTALVGGPSDSAGVGSAWVFNRTNNVWSIQCKLSGKGGIGLPSQGVSVALSGDGNSALIGGLGDNGSIGAVWSFLRDKSGIWSQNGNKLVGSGSKGASQQGYALAISSDGLTAAVGGDQDNNGQGAVWIFKNKSGSWSQQGNKLNDASILNANQGSSVALNADGTTMVVGIPFYNNGQGIATIYKYSGTTWVKQSDLNGLNITGLAQFGYSVSISADGNTAIIGAPYDNKNIGASWAFTRNSNVWSQRGNKLLSSGYIGESYFGSSVTISADGNTAFMGANFDSYGKGAVWNFVSSPVPRIGSVTPDSAIAGQTVIIKGANLSSVSDLSFGNVIAKSFLFTVVNGDTMISAVVSTGASGYVKVTNPYGTDSAAGFIFLTCQPVFTTTSLAVCASELPYIWNGVICKSAGTYKATLKSISGCDSIVTLNLSININPIVKVPSDTSGCSSASITAKGAVTFLWSGGQNPNSPTNTFIESGAYTVKATDANNCSSNASVYVTIFPLPFAKITGKLSGCDSIKLYGSGGNKYLWSSGSTPTKSSNSFNKSGSYTLIVTDSSTKCSSSISFKDTIYSHPTISIGGIFTGCDSTKVWVKGAPINSSFHWNGGKNFVSDTNNIISSGNYIVSVLDTNGCVTVTNKAVTINNSPKASVVGKDTACNFVILTGSGGKTYSWSGGKNPSSQTDTFTLSGRYALTVKDANGCTNYDSVYVKVNLPPAFTVQQSNNGCGSVFLTAVPADTTEQLVYDWNGLGSFPNLRSNTFSVSGNYSVKVTDTLTGCFGSVQQSVSITSQHTVSLINSGGNSCLENANLTVSGASSAYKAVIFKDSAYYSNSVLLDTIIPKHVDSILNGESFISISNYKPEGEGRYFAFVYFNDGCNATTPYDTVRIAKIGINGLATACKQVVLTATGGKSYTWNGGTSPNLETDTFKVIGSQNVSVSAVDSNGCVGTASQSIIVNNFPSPIGVIVSNNGLNVGCDSILLTASVSGGNGAYNYLWLNGGKSPKSATNCFYSSGTDTVKVTDGNGCSIFISKQIKINPHPKPFIKAYQHLCGKTILSAAGGNSYLWSDGLNINSPIDTITLSGANIPISLKVTDSNNCSSTLFDTIYVKALPVIKYEGNTASCDSVVLNVSGGSGYYWSGGKYVTSNRNVFVNSDVYNITSINLNGCSDSLKINVTVNPTKAAIDIIANPSNICQGDSVTYLATSTNGGIFPMYSWYIGNLLQKITNSASFIYAPTTKDSIKCILKSDLLCLLTDTAVSNIVTENITQKILPSIILSASSLSICKGTAVTFTAKVLNAGNYPSFRWRKNKLIVGNDDSSYTDNSLNDKDSIYCELISSLPCTLKPSVFSNAVVVKIKTPSNSTTNVSVCPTALPYTWNGTAYSVAGTYTKTLVNAVGCDSVATLNLSIKATSSSITNATIIQGDSYIFNGTTYTSAGTYTAHLTNSVGCDSAATLVLTVTPTYIISGNVKNPLGTVIPSVTVSLNGKQSVVNTDISGNYNFTTIANSNNSIKPSKNNDKNVANGINGTDISLIQSHILKKVILNSPYKLIAADVNNDGAVNGTDIALIKSIILKRITQFSGSRLWSFVDSSYKFPIPTKPFPYYDSINIAAINTNQLGKNFIGVKLGDVNYDWNSAVLGIDSKSAPIELFNDNILVNNTASEVRIPIKVNNFRNIMGMQYTLNFNSSSLELKAIENNKLNADYNLDFTPEGKIPFLWVEPASEPKTIADSTVLFELVFNKKGNFTKESLSLSSDITLVNAFDGNYATVGIVKQGGVITEQNVIENSFVIYPNPAKDKITIKGSYINEVQIVDYMGKIVKLISLHQAINPTIQVSELTSGIYQLRIQSNEGKVKSIAFIKE